MTEWTIDELAREAGTTVRNIRVYQDRGLLEPPSRRGRVGIYSQDHLDRLRLILRLLERGYPMAAISELLEAWKGQRGLGAILGFDEAIHRDLINEEPLHLSVDEMAELFPGDDGEALNSALRIGLVETDGDGFITKTPGLLQAGAQLVADGIPVGPVTDVGEAIWQKTDELAHLMIDAFVRHVWEPFERAGMPEEGWPRIFESIEHARQSALTGVTSALSGAVQRAIEEKIAQLGDPLALRRDEGRAAG